MTLQPCGFSSKTLWFCDTFKTASGPYFALVSAATDNSFADPYVMTAFFPDDLLLTFRLQLTPTAKVIGNQLWGSVTGVLPPGAGASSFCR